MVFYCDLNREADEYIVNFPDMPGAITSGDTIEEALKNAKEALNGCLAADIVLGNHVPEPLYKKGYAIPVNSEVVLALQLRTLRGNESKKAVAQKLGISYQAYQQLEDARKTNPTIKTLEKIAKAYGKTLEVNFCSAG
jgi:antitoxin HicB